MPIFGRALDKLQSERESLQDRKPDAKVRKSKGASTSGVESAQAKKVDIDLEQFQSAGLVPGPDAGNVDVRKHFQAMKRPLLTNAFDSNLGLERANMILVTSPLPDAGKTFVSVNLAMSLGLERDKGVVLVDGDVAVRHLTRALGLEDAPGLMDLIVNPDKDVNDVILETKIRGLRILPAGSPQSDATELLASERMSDIGAQLVSRYGHEIVIWDSPPMLITNEAAVIASLMGQVLVVVEAGGTSKTAVHDTLQLMDRVKGDRAVNLILNKTTQSVSENQYGDYGADD